MRLKLSLANQFFTVSHSLFRSYQSGIDRNNLCARTAPVTRSQTESAPRDRTDRCQLLWPMVVRNTILEIAALEARSEHAKQGVLRCLQRTPADRRLGQMV